MTITTVDLNEGEVLAIISAVDAVLRRAVAEGQDPLSPNMMVAAGQYAQLRAKLWKLSTPRVQAIIEKLDRRLDGIEED